MAFLGVSADALLSTVSSDLYSFRTTNCDALAYHHPPDRHAELRSSVHCLVGTGKCKETSVACTAWHVCAAAPITLHSPYACKAYECVDREASSTHPASPRKRDRTTCDAQCGHNYTPIESALTSMLSVQGQRAAGWVRASLEPASPSS